MKSSLRLLLLGLILCLSPAVSARVLPFVSRPLVFQKGSGEAGLDLEVGLVHDRSFKDYYIYSHEPVRRLKGLWGVVGVGSHLMVGGSVAPLIIDRRGKRFGGVQFMLRWSPFEWVGTDVGLGYRLWAEPEERSNCRVWFRFGIPLHIPISRDSFGLEIRPDVYFGFLPDDSSKGSMVRVVVDSGIFLNLSRQVVLAVLAGYRRTVRPLSRYHVPISLLFAYTLKSGWTLRGSLDFWDLHPGLGLDGSHYRGLSIGVVRGW